MARQEVLQQLTRLRQEIDTLSEDDAELASRLRDAAESLQQQVDAPVVHGESPSFEHQLEDYITEFEASHPALTSVLNDLLVKLSSMGV